MKQAIKKGAGIKKKGISAWKEKVGLNVTAANLEEIGRASCRERV